MRLFYAIALFAVFPLRAQVPAQYPDWWTEYAVIDPDGDHGDNTSVVNQGQAKHMVSRAIAYLDALLAPLGGAGITLDSLLDSEKTPDHHAPLNLGQLKNLSAPFYDRFSALGFTASSPGWPVTLILDEGAEDLSKTYPWLEDVTPLNYEPACIGQLKHLFSWDLSIWIALDTDADGMPDYWEKLIVDADTADNLDEVTDVMTNGDFDGDGVGNLEEFLNGANPLLADTDSDGREDADEVNLGTNAARPDNPEVGLLVY